MFLVRICSGSNRQHCSTPPFVICWCVFHFRITYAHVPCLGKQTILPATSYVFWKFQCNYRDMLSKHEQYATLLLSWCATLQNRPSNRPDKSFSCRRRSRAHHHQAGIIIIIVVLLIRDYRIFFHIIVSINYYLN